MKASNGTTGACIACFLVTGLAQAAAVYSSLQHVANIGHATMTTVGGFFPLIAFKIASMDAYSFLHGHNSVLHDC